MKGKLTLKKIWHFIWEDERIWSWLVNIVIAFVLIKYLVYPGLGLALNTSHPVVAVVSESMEHSSAFDDWWKKANDKYTIEKTELIDGIPQKIQSTFDEWYINNGINKEGFADFPLKNGFNKSDIIMLKGKKAADIKIGDVVVFWSQKNDPIIHRVVKKWQENSTYYFQTKGDNYKTNPTSIKNVFLDETRISEDQIVGNAIARIPLLGYIKIWFVELLVNPFLNTA